MPPRRRSTVPASVPVGARAPAVLHEEPGLIVVDKPAGLPATGRDAADGRSALALVSAALGRRLWAVHQLDQDTSGLLLLTDDKRGVERWQARLRAGSKLYFALVHGALSTPEGGGALRFDAPVGGKAAETLVESLTTTADPFPAVTAVLCRPKTGRTHQIRVHLAGAGCPLVGERRYRDPPSTLLGRHALHAWRVRVAGREVVAPLPPDLVELADRLGLELPLCPPA